MEASKKRSKKLILLAMMLGAVTVGTLSSSKAYSESFCDVDPEMCYDGGGGGGGGSGPPYQCITQIQHTQISPGCIETLVWTCCGTTVLYCGAPTDTIECHN